MPCFAATSESASPEPSLMHLPTSTAIGSDSGNQANRAMSMSVSMSRQCRTAFLGSVREHTVQLGYASGIRHFRVPGSFAACPGIRQRAKGNDHALLTAPGRSIRPGSLVVLGTKVGRKPGTPQNYQEKSRARLASPQPRPTSPVNGAGGNNRLLRRLATHGVVPGRLKIFSHTVM